MMCCRGTWVGLILVVISLVAVVFRTVPFQDDNDVLLHSRNNRITTTLRQLSPPHDRSNVPIQNHHIHRFFRHDVFPIDNDEQQQQQPINPDDDDAVPKVQSRKNILIEIPIIIQLSGEFGNHLSKIAAGIGVAAMIHSYNNNNNPVMNTATPFPTTTNQQQLYHFTSNLHIRHQDHTTKGDTAMQILQQCFPNLLHIEDRDINDDEGTDNDDAATATTMIIALQQQIALLTSPTTNPYWAVNSNRAVEVDTTIHRIVQDAIYAYETVTKNDPLRTVNATTTVTPVYSNHLVGYFDVYMDRFYHLYRHYFVMNETNPICGCRMNDDDDDDNRVVVHDDGNDNNMPLLHKHNTNEIVFYYRGYQIEMPKKAKRLGYEEIQPDTLVSYLQEQSTYIDASKTQRQQIAIVSRFPNHTQPYVTALTDAGFVVRVVQHMSTGNSKTSSSVTSILHDFCLLRRSTQRLIGPIRSTFFMWASILAVRTNATDEYHSSSRLHVTAYTTASQIEWAKQLPSNMATSTTAAMDSITPTLYYHDENDDTNSTDKHYQSLWRERNFHFPML